MSKTKPLKLPRELTFILGIIILPFAVALCTKANLGLSMIASPTYIISEKLSFISYGQTEYAFQAIVLILMCIAVKKFKWTYLFSFLTAVIYGSVLDLFIWMMSGWEVTQLWLRVVLFVFGILFTSIGVALFMNTYLPPCAYDFFVRTVVQEKQTQLRKVKLSFDFSFLILSVILTLLLHHKFVGVTWGTLIIAIVNGNLISLFDKLINKHFELYNLFDRFSKIF